jgi:uncharacterized protein YqeY
MSLELKVQEEMKNAMRAKDQVALVALRAIKSAILYAKTSEGRSDEPLSDAEEMALLVKQAKQRRDSIDSFRQNNRPDLAEKEEAELKVIQIFMPQQLTQDELVATVKAIVAEVGATSMKDMRKVMEIATPKLAGQAEPQAISAAVKAALS